MTVAVAALLLLPATASAVPFDVDTTADGADSSPGDGTCLATSIGCTLRAAVEEANSLAGDDTVAVPAGTYILLSNVGGAIEITGNVVITGPSARTTHVRSEVDSSTGDGLDRVFDITGLSTRVTLQGLDITNGRALDAAGFFGGNIRSEGILTIRRSRIAGGRASSGGGLTNVGGQMTLIDSLVVGNQAPDNGGDSGAIQNQGTDTRAATLVITNSTITGNSARLGGGIFSWRGSAGTADKDQVTITNTTITDNASGDRGGGGGLLSTASSVFTLVNTIVAKNRSPSDASHPNCTSDVAGPLVSGGHNLESGTDCGFTAAGDLQSADPLLGNLGDFGGGTDTMPIPSNSPAADAGDNGPCPGRDQRDVLRPQGVACDIGAFEIPVPPSARTTDATDMKHDGARLTGAVFPSSQATTYSFEYGPTTAYGSATPVASAGSGGTEQPVAADVSGLQPSTTYHYRVVASSPAGTATGADVAFTTPAQPSLVDPIASIANRPLKLADLPPAVFAKTANVEPVTGDVFISVPAGAATTRQAVPASPIKGRVFVPLQEARQIPVGSYLDTRKGRVRVATAGARTSIGQTGEFFAGVFQVLQRRQDRGLTELRLQGSSFGARCGKAVRSRAQIARRKRLPRRVVRQVRSKASGRFRTRGRYAAATVRGTEWDTVDRCDGTLTRVRRGRVSVFDLVKRKTVTVRAGKSYLAKAPL